jgi:hypothetical protein
VRSTPNERTSFAKSLPQEILSALVVVLSDMPANAAPHTAKHTLSDNPDEVESEYPRTKIAKRSRKSGADLISASAPNELYEVKPAIKMPGRKSESGRRTSRRASGPSFVDNNPNFTPEKEMEYCRDLIKRMISGPGYWTRYVANFKKPVDPVLDNAPHYFDVIKNPMNLNTIKMKMDNGKYSTASEFEADIRLIFQNCYEYWTPKDRIWQECETFEDFFNNQWAARHKYSSTSHGKRVKAEVTE